MSHSRGKMAMIEKEVECNSYLGQNWPDEIPVGYRDNALSVALFQKSDGQISECHALVCNIFLPDKITIWMQMLSYHYLHDIYDQDTSLMTALLDTVFCRWDCEIRMKVHDHVCLYQLLQLVFL